MPQSEDTGSAAPRHPETLQILLPRGLWCELPYLGQPPWAMILLRGLHRRDGWPLVPMSTWPTHWAMRTAAMSTTSGPSSSLWEGSGGLFPAA